MSVDSFFKHRIRKCSCGKPVMVNRTTGECDPLFKKHGWTKPGRKWLCPGCRAKKENTPS